ncbi:MAG TPA: EmrB/QacA family drug resistance transporter, partial [Devosia sp.]|jgi:DHA2 family multidrug resistance protein|nr:EmrB/QacA family drug resistance transporter [Devosia sp.]
VDATAFFSLVRNVGQGVGISVVTTVLAHMMQVNNAELAARVSLDSQAVRDFPGMLQGAPSAIQSLGGLVQQQAAMIGYLDDFWLMAIVTVLSAPLVLLLRKPKDAGGKVDLAHAMGE